VYADPGLLGTAGLYVARNLAAAFQRKKTIAGLFGRPYWESRRRNHQGRSPAAKISDADLGRMANEAYATFRHSAVVPLDQIGPQSIFCWSLFHGPTLGLQGRGRCS